MTEQVPSDLPRAGGGIVEAFTEGGALTALIGRSAATALSRLIGIGLNYPEALMASHTQKIKDDADARSLISKQMSQVIADRAAADPDILERTAQRLLGRAVKNQINLEAVAVAAAEDLAHEPPPSDGAEVDEEFIERLADAAKSASGEQMRALYARVMAGEIRQPGRFSFASLQALSLMDPKVAKQLERVASALVIESILIKSEPLTANGGMLKDLLVAQDFGLLRSQELSYTGPQEAIVGFSSRAGGSFTLERTDESMKKSAERGRPMRFEGWPLSPVGEEVFSLMAPKLTEADLQMLAQSLAKGVGAKRVTYHPPAGLPARELVSPPPD